MYEKTVLANGLRILTAEMNQVRSVSLTLFFGVGSRYETAELAGMSHFIEHMFFKGSKSYHSAQQISAAIEGVGGLFNGGTGKELTVYSAKVGSIHFDRAMDVLIDIVRHPLFDPAELEKERRVILEELNMYKDSPQDWVHVLIEEAVFPNHPLGRDEAGTKESVTGLSRAQMLDFFQRYYTPNNLVVSVAGNVTHKQVVDAVTKRLGGWGAGNDLPRWTPASRQYPISPVLLATKDTEQANVCIATLGVSHSDPDFYTLSLLNTILGEGMSSRLFVEIREEKGLAYDVHSYLSNYHETGNLVIYAGVDPERIDITISSCLAQLHRLVQEAVPGEELARAKEYTKGRILLRIEETNNVASWLGGQEILRNEVTEVDEAVQLVDAVSATDLQRLARQLFTQEALRLALVGPFEDRAHFEKLLQF